MFDDEHEVLSKLIWNGLIFVYNIRVILKKKENKLRTIGDYAIFVFTKLYKKWFIYFKIYQCLVYEIQNFWLIVYRVDD